MKGQDRLESLTRKNYYEAKGNSSNLGDTTMTQRHPIVEDYDYTD